jgi:hypothetical protein
MGFGDFLKNLFPQGENPLQAMEPQCLRYRWVTLRLPTGWRFTQADGRSFRITGPGDCLVDGFFSDVSRGRHYVMARDFDQKRDEIVELASKHFLEGKSLRPEVLPAGALWLEAADTKADRQRLRIVLINPRPHNQERLPPMLLVTCTASGAPSDAFRALRDSLRSAQWN